MRVWLVQTCELEATWNPVLSKFVQDTQRASQRLNRLPTNMHSNLAQMCLHSSLTILLTHGTDKTMKNTSGMRNRHGVLKDHVRSQTQRKDPKELLRTVGADLHAHHVVPVAASSLPGPLPLPLSLTFLARTSARPVRGGGAAVVFVAVTVASAAALGSGFGFGHQLAGLASALVLLLGSLVLGLVLAAATSGGAASSRSGQIATHSKCQSPAYQEKRSRSVWWSFLRSGGGYISIRRNARNPFPDQKTNQQHPTYAIRDFVFGAVHWLGDGYKGHKRSKRNGNECTIVPPTSSARTTAQA